jgi:hypothetical protein
MEAHKNDITGKWTLTGVKEFTIETICDLIKSNVNFKFARYGDGEIFCMTGKAGSNCDGHEYFEDLGQRLRESLKDPDYIIGIQPLSVAHLRDKVDGLFSHLNLVDADVLHSASIDKKLNLFMEAISSRYVIIVGPPHLASLLDECVHIVIPTQNCWLQYEKVKKDLAFHLEDVKDAVVLLCASMMSEVLISDFKNEDHTFIDCGSVFDPYCHVRSRSYHYKL